MRWWRHRGSFFCDTYGSTELGLGGIMRWWAPGSRPRPCVQGRPFPRAFAVRIVDPSWRDLPRGAVGRILVRASTHFHGYWNGHDTWARHRIDGWWWGGDVGRIDERGELLFLDREDDVVHTATGPIYSLPVEELLLSHPRVMEAAVFARPAADGRGDEAIAWIVPRGWLQRSAISLSRERIQALEAELLEFAGRQLDTPGLAAVKTVALDELPLGATGKLLKRRLRELAVRPVHDDREPALAGGMNQ
jgi:acyl-coenzyme A synthetase/AMP-(fatty) acid ligase